MKWGETNIGVVSRTTTLGIEIQVLPVDDLPSIHLRSHLTQTATSTPDNVWYVNEDEDMVVQGLRVNDVDLVRHGFDHHHVVVEITVDHGSFSISNVVAPLLLLDNTKPTRSKRIVMRGYVFK